MVLALCVFAIGYRYYSAFLAAKVLALDDRTVTPAHRLCDRQNYHPTTKWVLFGHHFAAISGAGPLVGPVLAAQFGYLPGYLWLVIGVVLAGAAQDFMVLVASIRRNGRSLAEIARSEVGPAAGAIAALAILFIIVNALAGLGLVVVKALGGESEPYPPGSVLTLEGSGGRSGAIRLLKVDRGEALYQVDGPCARSCPGQKEPWRSAEPVRVAVPLPALAGRPPESLAGGASLELPAGAARRIAGSSWGTFTIGCTIPIALLVGLWMYRIRKGRVVEASLIGGALVILATYLGGLVRESPSLGPLFELSRDRVVLALAVYAFFASVLPVWLLLLPRDYLSTFLKLGTLAALVVGVLLVNPELKMPAVTAFAAGGGPIIKGQVFPFVFITIMCGAISGFHALVSSGTTPKMLDRESHARAIGYGSMLLEGLVGVVALVAASSLEPVDYFKINVDLKTQSLARYQDNPLMNLGQSELMEFESGTREELQGRAGGAVSLAVGIAKIFSGLPFFKHLMAFWYHFAIMFEALFILTTVDAGTRIARFLVQELGGKVWPRFGRTTWLPGSIVSSALVVAGFSYFIQSGSIETIWPMFGIANQLLAVVALCVVTAFLINSGRRRFVWVSLVPMAWVLATTSTAGYQLIFGEGYFLDRIRQDPGSSFRWKLNIALTAAMLALVALIVAASARRWVAAWRAGDLARPPAAAPVA
jgi:carbon starvation protein